MNEKRVTVYGTDDSSNCRRMFDWVMHDGKPYAEVKDSHGNMIRAPASLALKQFKILTGRK